MHSPKAPAPDPAIAAAQATEQRRAEAGQVSQTQYGLNADTAALRRRFGVMANSVGGSAAGFSGVTPASTFADAVAASAGGGIFAPSGFGGGGFGSGGGLGGGLVQLS